MALTTSSWLPGLLMSAGHPAHPVCWHFKLGGWPDLFPEGLKLRLGPPAHLTQICVYLHDPVPPIQGTGAFLCAPARATSLPWLAIEVRNLLQMRVLKHAYM